MPIWALDNIERKLNRTIYWCLAGQVVLMISAIWLPAVVWFPALVASIGVELSCGIQLRKLEEMKFERWLSNSHRAGE